MATQTTNGRSRQTRYPIQYQQFARGAYERGHDIATIRAALAKRGITPDYQTVLVWADPDYARLRKLQMHRKGGRPGTAHEKSWHFILRRMRELRELKVSYRSIADIVNHDLGTAINEEQARGILSGRTSERRVRALLSAVSN